MGPPQGFPRHPVFWTISLIVSATGAVTSLRVVAAIAPPTAMNRHLAGECPERRVRCVSPTHSSGIRYMVDDEIPWHVDEFQSLQQSPALFTVRF